MQFQFTLQYRDELEATRARFRGQEVESPGAAAGGRSLPAGVVAWSLISVIALAIYLLLHRAPAASRAAVPVVEQSNVSPLPDPLDDPQFAAGAMVAGLAAACYVVPLAYLIGLRRSQRPLHERPATVSLTDAGLALRTDAKELSADWSGVVAMAETRNLFVFRTMGDLRLTLPKRALGDVEAVNDLRGFLHLHIAPLADVAAPAAPAASGGAP